MTEQWRYGMKDKKFKIKAESPHTKDEIEWEGEETETDQVALVNDPKGKPIVMRIFDFDLPPLPPEQFPTAEQLLSVHKSKITAFLWRDELVPIYEPKLIFSKDKLHFRIFSTCQAKSGSVILEKPESLQNYLK